MSNSSAGVGNAHKVRLPGNVASPFIDSLLRVRVLAQSLLKSSALLSDELRDELNDELLTGKLFGIAHEPL